MVDTYNNRYSNLDESEKLVVRTLFSSTDEEKKEVYNTLLKECVVLLDETLKDSDLETKEKLLIVKDRLLNDRLEIMEDFNKKISKLVELRGNLK
jgi:ATP-dependent protease HslVU (ClpYQ) peptidase subunit